IYDAANNVASYDANELAALGSTTFTLTNAVGYDIVAPTLASGTIETPTIRRSKPPKGTPAGTPPYVSADLSITDAGNGVISGNYEAYVELCHLNGSGSCDDYLYLQGTTNQAGVQANTITVGNKMRIDQTLGQYVMQYIELFDVAENATYYGTSTDFSHYFPQGSTVFINQ
ncbi:MAG TPA: hypothetical protein VH328_14390, partial [Burkholderiaceae bacterium]|nr:hypothetical protein [Burkholderiaceae bacterium]